MRIFNRPIQTIVGHAARSIGLLQRAHRSLSEVSKSNAPELHRVVGERSIGLAKGIRNMSRRFSAGLCQEMFSTSGDRIWGSDFIFEPHDMKKTVSIDKERATFLKSYFDIATKEYEAATRYFVPLIQEIARSRDGNIYVLDVGCGQGHLFRTVLGQLPEEVKERIIIDYLDPQIENLFRYEEVVNGENLGMRYCAKWEEFYSDRTRGRLNHYDLIIAFQSLYSFDLLTFGSRLKGFQELLGKNSIAVIGHCTPQAVYLKLFESLGPLFHRELPRLNTIHDITRKLDELNIDFDEELIPVNQEIHASKRDDLLVYLAACLYLMSTDLIADSWESVSAGIQNYLTEGDEYVFPQDIVFIKIRTSN